MKQNYNHVMYALFPGLIVWWK